MKDKKKIVIGTLCALIMIMAVGYALLSQQLSINGSASIISNWQVEITNITEKEKSTGTTTNSTNYTATTASFNTSLTSPGDYALYEVTVTNKGTLDAVLAAKPTVTTGNNEAIQYELEGIKKGDKILKNNQTDTFTIKVQYNPNVTSQPSTLTSNIEVTLNYQQDLGQVSPYDGYAIGDVITFNNANWRVIKASAEAEDYVTVMKEKVLTNAELGSYGVSKECTSYDVAYSQYTGCFSIGEAIKFNSIVKFGDYNDYSNSEVKKFLEEIYLPAIDSTSNKIKAVDGYKIRLITLEELQQNLGASTTINNSWYDASTSDSLKWVYQNYGEGNNGVSGYWTMTSSADDPQYVWSVYMDGRIMQQTITSRGTAVRPVINLYKSAIE